MDISDELGGVFIKAEHLRDGSIRETVADVRPGRYGNDMELSSGNVLGLNKTNLHTLASAWGPETDAWIGKEVELYVGKTMYQGQQHDSVLVRTISPHTAWRSAGAAKLTTKQELDDDIPF